MKYIIHYDVDDSEGRGYALSAVNKANYIINALNEVGYDVSVVSVSLTSKKGYIKASKTKLSDKTILNSAAGKLIRKYLKQWITRIYLFIRVRLSQPVWALWKRWRAECAWQAQICLVCRKF